MRELIVDRYWIVLFPSLLVLLLGNFIASHPRQLHFLSSVLTLWKHSYWWGTWRIHVDGKCKGSSGFPSVYMHNTKGQKPWWLRVQDTLSIHCFSLLTSLSTQQGQACPRKLGEGRGGLALLWGEMRPHSLWLEGKVDKHIQSNCRISKLCHLLGEGRNPIQNQGVPCLGQLMNETYTSEQNRSALAGSEAVRISCLHLHFHPRPSLECPSCLCKRSGWAEHLPPSLC